MKNRSFLTMMTCVCAVFMSTCFLLTCAETGLAQDCRIIRIHGMDIHESFRVEPETMWVTPDTCIIWFNRSTAKEVKIVFEEGKRCSSVSDAAVGFSLDHENCFVTSWIPFGGTSSLRFKEKGTYEYQIEIAGAEPGGKGTRVAKGTILVQ